MRDVFQLEAELRLSGQEALMVVVMELCDLGACVRVGMWAVWGGCRVDSLMVEAAPEGSPPYYACVRPACCLPRSITCHNVTPALRLLPPLLPQGRCAKRCSARPSGPVPSGPSRPPT